MISILAKAVAEQDKMILTFTTNNVSDSLLLILLGMVGIFVVMLVIMGAVALLNKFAKDKDNK